ncbi:Tubulin-specific chaperone E [Phlyctema vagabunda]|uniref:Tubulin-specific chaperone E n=1 Tax=Phlyctema vagabunda TaxID=108571 RepID=A0ABR4PC15_9HELO
MEPTPTEKGPGHFLVRNTGEVVPLIPVDELSSDVEVIGVPRSLDLTATVGMLNLGLIRSTGHVYSIIQKKGEGEKSKAHENKEREKLVIKPTTSTRFSSSPKVEASPKHIYSGLGGLAASRHRPRSPVQTCKHWCAHGICKWGQQCRYLHIMPMTLSGLREAGLNDWPVWYRNLNPGYFHDEAMLAQPPDQSHSRRADCCAHSHHQHSPHARGLGASSRRAAAVAHIRDDERAGLEVLQRLSSYARPAPVSPIPNSVAGKEEDREKKKSSEEAQVRQALKKKKDVKVMVERAAGRDARAWGNDDSSESSGSDGEGEREAARNNVKAAELVEVEKVKGKKKSDEKVAKLVDV